MKSDDWLSSTAVLCKWTQLPISHNNCSLDRQRKNKCHTTFIQDITQMMLISIYENLKCSCITLTPNSHCHIVVGQWRQTRRLRQELRWDHFSVVPFPLLLLPHAHAGLHTHMLTMTNGLWRASVNMARKGPLPLPRADRAAASAGGGYSRVSPHAGRDSQWIISPSRLGSGETYRGNTTALVEAV